MTLELGYDRLYRRGSGMGAEGLRAKAAAYQAAGFPSGINTEGNPAAGASRAMLQEALAVFKEVGGSGTSDAAGRAQLSAEEGETEANEDGDEQEQDQDNEYEHDDEEEMRDATSEYDDEEKQEEE